MITQTNSIAVGGVDTSVAMEIPEHSDVQRQDTASGGTGFKHLPRRTFTTTANSTPKNTWISPVKLTLLQLEPSTLLHVHESFTSNAV